MSPDDKPLVWFHGEIKTPSFSRAARLEAGYLLRLLQRGELLGMPHARPMPLIGPSCHELRVDDAGNTWRIVYRIDPNAIVILEVFSKKTRATPRAVTRHVKEDLGSTKMREEKKKRLEARGWKIGGTKEFLGLSDEESAYIDLKIRLAESLRERRERRRLSQVDLAKLLKSSQSRIAKMEAGDPSVSLDLLIRSLLALGTSNRELSRIISTSRSASAT